jgi:hypothetical protein
MPPNPLIAVAGRDTLTVSLTRLPSPGTFPPPPPLQQPDGEWIERSALYAGDGVRVDYENVVWLNSSRTSFALAHFPGDARQYATLENAESLQIVASAVAFDAVGTSIHNIETGSRVVSASVIGDLQRGLYNHMITALVGECAQTQSDLQALLAALDATQVPNRQLSHEIQQLQSALQKTTEMIQQVRESMTSALLAQYTIPFDALRAEIHAHVERVNAFIADAFRVEQDANTLRRLFSCQAVPFTSPIVARIQDRATTYAYLSTVDYADDQARLRATEQAWGVVERQFRQSQDAWKSAEVQSKLSQLTAAQVASLERRNMDNIRAVEQLKGDLAELVTKVSYYASTYIVAVGHMRVITIYLRLYDAGQRAILAKAAYDAYLESLRLLEWRRTFQQLKQEEAEWRSKQSSWNHATRRLMFRVVSLYDGSDAFREYTDELRDVLARITSAESQVSDFNDRARAFMEGKPAKVDALAEMAVRLEVYATEMRRLSELLRTHAHDMTHVQLVHDYTEQMPTPADFAWVRATRVCVVDLSSRLLRRLLHDAMHMWSNQRLFDAGRLTEVDVVASCTSAFVPIKQVSWGDLVYICRQMHEVLYIVYRGSFRPEIMVAMAPSVGVVDRRMLQLRTLLNGRVRQHANNARACLYEASSQRPVECESLHHVRSLCEGAMQLVRICAHVHLMDHHFPLVRLPLPEAMSVLAMYHDAITKGIGAHQRAREQWLVDMAHRRAVWRDSYTQLQSHSTMLQNKHAQSMQQFYVAKTLLSDKAVQLKHKRVHIDQLQQRIDELLLIQHELACVSDLAHTGCDASGLHGVGYGHEAIEPHLHKQMAELQMQLLVLTNEMAELEHTIQSSHTTDDESELQRTIAQCNDVSARLRALQVQMHDESDRHAHATRLAGETIRGLQSELARPDHLCRPMVCGTLRTWVQNPLFNHHRTRCKVHVVVCQVAYLKHVSLKVNAIQWVDSSNVFWKNAPYPCTPFAPSSLWSARCLKSQLTPTNAFEHAAVLHLHLPVAIARQLSTVRSMVLDVSVSLCYHDVATQQERRVTSRHVTSTGVCVKPSFGPPPTSILNAASLCFVVLMLHVAIRRHSDY